MENFNKASLESAVKKYGQLHTDGKAEGDVKDQLAKDTRGFTAEQIDDIYKAIVGEDGKGQGVVDSTNDSSSVVVGEKTPEWVQTILDSNQAVLESNQAVISALEDLKSFADERSSNSSGTITTKFLAEDQFDEDADYEVAEGKSFADKDNFTKKYNEGDDVTHLGAERLKVLLSQGLIVEA